jgi:hypothetical protein
MSSIVAIPRRRVPAQTAASVQERWVRRRVGLAWAMLILNVLPFFATTWSGLPLALPIPSVLGKLITQGSLPLALLLALTVNRRLLIRKNFFLCILTLLVVVAFMVTLEPGHLSTIYRSFRLAGFVATLWLLTPWWGRRDMLLVRCHLATIGVVLGTVVLGFMVSPHTAYAEHRLEGALWPYPPTQVAHFAAVMIGIVTVLWFCRLVSGRVTLATAAVCGVILLLSHTRTALAAMLAGIIIAGLSLVAVHARVRKAFATGAIIAAIVAITLSGFVSTWLARGESAQQLTSLTGRTDVWTAILSAPRNEFQVIFGLGLSNLSFNGLSIDSNWLGSYLDLGLAGAAIGAAMLLFLFVSACFAPRGPQRAIALFLITYCTISSFTETGLSDPSLYLLELALAASLLLPAIVERRQA